MIRSTLILATVTLLGIFSLESFAQENQFILKVANYNVKGLPLPWLKHKKRFPKIIEDLKKLDEEGRGPHIISFQEAMSSKTKVLHENLNFPYRAKGPKRKFLKSNAGLETLSRFPITSHKTLAYSRCAGFDCLARKGLQYLKIQIPGVPSEIQLINTHMQAGPGKKGYPKDSRTKEVRAHQAAEYMSFLYSQAEQDLPLFLIGDFNFRQSNELYAWFLALTGTDNVAYQCAVELECAGSEDPYRIWLKLIDHQFYSNGNNQLTIRPIHFETLFTDRKNTDHDLIMVHYLISW